MIAIVAKLRVKPGKEAEFEKAFSAMIPEVHKEPGNLLYRLCKAKDGSAYTVIETYADQESVNAHGKTLKTAGKALEGLVDGAPEIEFLEVVAG